MNTPTARARILHVITDLEAGGAETMLVKLVEETRQAADVKVISLMSGGSLTARLQQLGIPFECIGQRQGGLPSLRGSFKLIRAAREFSPTVVQGWMYHGNLAAWLISKFLAPKIRLFWNIRQTLYDEKLEKPLTRVVIRAGQALSSAPEAIIYNSQLSAEQHEAAGYDASKRLIIPNGFNLERFRFNPEAGAAIRQEFGFAKDDLVIAHISRFHPMKDQKTLLDAAKIVSQQACNARFLFVGRGLTPDNAELFSWIDERGLSGHITLAGPRGDIPQLLSACDLFVSPSAWGDAFPNAIGEAMAVEVPCVVTDVGESARIVGEFGEVVPVKAPEQMAAAIERLLALKKEKRNSLGICCRNRIKKKYSIERIGQIYSNTYD